MKLVTYILLATVFLLSGCKKDEKFYHLTLKINYEVDGQRLDFDKQAYTNEAGNVYSVQRLEYYLSDFRLKKEDGSEVFIDEVMYINAKESSLNTFVLKRIPEGNYHSLSFLIGLAPEKNKTGALPNTIENINMAWPDQMGGGYHFMKLEGYYNDTTSSTGSSGYAMHLGKDNNLVPISPIGIYLVMDKLKTIELTMNINEWYRNPHVYNFKVDGNYSMTDMPAMMKLAANGKSTFKAHVTQ